jgi:hypothetical protein
MIMQNMYLMEKQKHLTRIATSDDEANMYLLHSYKKEQGEE